MFCTYTDLYTQTVCTYRQTVPKSILFCTYIALHTNCVLHLKAYLQSPTHKLCLAPKRILQSPTHKLCLAPKSILLFCTYRASEPSLKVPTHIHRHTNCVLHLKASYSYLQTLTVIATIITSCLLAMNPWRCCIWLVRTLSVPSLADMVDL